MKLFFSFVFFISVFFVSNLYAQSILKAGTQVPVKLTLDASSQGRVTPTAIVAEDILTPEGILAIRRGTSVEVFYYIEKARPLGEPGKLTLGFETTRTVNKMRVPLECNNMVRTGRERQALAIGLGVGGGCLITPLFLCLLIKGTDACIPAGTIFSDVYVAENISITE